MVAARKPAKPTGIDYSALAFPKGESRKTTKARKDLANRTTKRDVKALVFARDVTCRAYGVAPVCRKRPEDRHELVPVGRGGKITTRNCVAVCRPCHDAAQNNLGGLPLVFDWAGKGDGQAPNADRPGHVRAVWKGLWRGVGERGSR